MGVKLSTQKKQQHPKINYQHKPQCDENINMTFKNENINLDELYKTGYQILKSHIEIPQNIKKQLMGFTYYENLDNGTIFNHNEMSDINDGKRKQYFIKPEVKSSLAIFMNELNMNLKSIFPLLYPNDWVILKSNTGCKPQAAHTDYFPPYGPVELYEIPINVLIALQKNTFLNVWPHSHKLISVEYMTDRIIPSEYIDQKPIHKKVIELEPGDVLLFRGDLVHGGAGYKETNYRMHCYLDYGYREPNKTWLVHRKGSELLKKMIVVDQRKRICDE